MAALDFPASPVVDQTYPTPPVSGQPVYTWDGEKWTTVGGTVGSTGASDAVPQPDTAAGESGSSTEWSRGDHAHPQNSVNKVGDTMTGNLTIDAVNPTLYLQSPDGSSKAIIGKSASATTHWAMQLGDGTAADDFVITRFDNAGTGTGTPLSITRGGGDVNIQNTITVGGLATFGTIQGGNIGGTGLTVTGNVSTATLTASGDISSDSLVTAPGVFASNGTITIQKGASTNPTFWLDEDNSGGHRSVLYFDTPTGQTKLQDWYSGGWLHFDPTGVFKISGAAFMPGGGPWSDSSDARIKNVEGDYTRGLDAVTALRPVTYTFKGNDTSAPPSNEVKLDDQSSKDAAIVPYGNSAHYHPAKAGTKFAGLVAQEVETVIPEMVTKRAGYIDGTAVTDLRDLDTTPLIYALVNAVKELKARIEQLEAA